MAARLPKADSNFKNYTNSKLFLAAQNIHNLILANVATFATPPVTMTQFQTDITAYKNALAAAIKGSKAQTATKDAAKKTVQYDLRILSVYVTQIAQAQYAINKDTTAVTDIINLSGFKISKTPGTIAALGGISAPQIRHAVSRNSGEISFVTRNYKQGNRAKKTYQVNYRTSAVGTTPAGPWQTQTITGGNKMTITGLNIGVSYDYQIAVIGGRDTKRDANNPINYTSIRSAVVTAGNNILSNKYQLK